jgi:hypothetical protein
MEIWLQTVFSVRSAHGAIRRKSRAAELMIQESRELVEGWQFSCAEKSRKSAAVNRRLRVSCSYSETVIYPLHGYD